MEFLLSSPHAAMSTLLSWHQCVAMRMKDCQPKTLTQALVQSLNWGLINTAYVTDNLQPF